MKTWNRRFSFSDFFWSCLLATEITFLIDLFSDLQFGKTKLAMFIATGGVCLAILLAAGKFFTVKLKRIISICLPLVLTLVFTFGFFGWKDFSNNAVYTQTDSGKSAFYADKKVMLIVPHEDDDLNVAGGVLDEYVKYKSEVYVVFVTNGDYYGLKTTRIDEAIACCEDIGIDEDHVVFLGYGDQWASNGVHIYNAVNGQCVTSHAGGVATYGSSTHPAFNNNHSYTRENYLSDMKEVILKYRPDTILCSDYDKHIDHRALTLAFEKVMGEILAENPTYRPIVYKAYAYNTAWTAAEDFFADNIIETKNIFESPYDQTPAVYRWSERVRMPVSASTLSRSLLTTGNYRGMTFYASKKSNYKAIQMTNSDKIFWQRRTDSLCLGASIDTTSGNKELLNDFMLLDCADLVGNAAPYDGVWIPSSDDTQPKITVTLPQKSYISQISLYDHPDANENIIDALISFDDGTEIHTGTLDANGAETVITVNKNDVKQFSITLLKTQGDSAGLTEVCAYSSSRQWDGGFIKLTDESDNFVYDYTVLDSVQSFKLYTYGTADNADNANNAYTVSCDGDNCQADIKDRLITVTCPVGSSCTVKVETKDGVFSDSAVIRNPNKKDRNATHFWQSAENYFYFRIKNSVPIEGIVRLKTKLAG